MVKPMFSENISKNQPKNAVVKSQQPKGMDEKTQAKTQALENK